jgi:hypothetical protein
VLSWNIWAFEKVATELQTLAKMVKAKELSCNRCFCFNHDMKVIYSQIAENKHNPHL